MNVNITRAKHLLQLQPDQRIISPMSRQALSGWRATSVIGIGVASVALILASYDRPVAGPVPSRAATDERPAEVSDLAERLPGTWLREQIEQGVRSRRLLQLEPGGTFRERVRIVTAAGEVRQHEHAGAWFYDGTNLKRKYTLMNGRPPSRLNLPFATFEIRFESPDEFVGLDRIHGNTVRYERVPAETEL